MNMNFVGQRIPMLDAAEKVSGRAIYTCDMVLPDMLHGAILRSPHRHAQILEYDISAALKVDGVVAIITGQDADKKYIHYGASLADRFPLARDVVRFVGEEVAAVAAESLQAAIKAAGLIVVRYKPLKAAFSTEEAMRAEGAILHQRDGLPPNHAQVTEADWGGVGAAVDRAKHVTKGTFKNPIVAPICMETNGVVASFDHDANTMDVWAGTQAPFFARKEIANILDLPLENVRFRSIFVGGGFGGKSQCPEPIGIAALLSRKAGRPVKIVLTRKEEFIGGKTDHGKSMTLTTAAAEDGRLLTRHVDFVIDNGAYTHMGLAYTSCVRQRNANLYRLETAGFHGRLVYTNKVPGGSYRGMGVPQIIWAIETQIDELAEKLGKDPLAYRLEIVNQPGDVTPQNFHISTCGLADCLREVGRRIGWEEKKRDKKPWRGIGFGAMINSSAGMLYPEGNFSKVAIEINPSGRFTLYTQATDCGTSQNTVLAQFAAEEIGAPISLFDVVHMDTEKAPDDLGSAASRVTFVTGSAAVEAGRKMKAEVVHRLAEIWAVASEDIVIDGDMIAFGADNEKRFSWKQVAELLGGTRVEGFWQVDLPRPDAKTGYGQYSMTYGFGAQAAEVEVDPETGRVRVLKIVAAADCGRIINPLAMDGQMHGGIVQGIGMTLSEELVFEEGSVVNTSLVTYRVPRIVEAAEIETCYIETNDPAGPKGAKAGGEHSINATVAAIANAIAAATGIRFYDLPITPQKILAALREKEGRKQNLQPWRRPYNLEVAAVRQLYPQVVFPALKKFGEPFKRERPKVTDYIIKRPKALAEALSLLSNEKQRTKLIAGGTDMLPGIRQGIYGPEILIDISGLAELRGITKTDNSVIVGSAVTLSEFCENADLRAHLRGLTDGVSLIATKQIRNAATVAGDLCQEKRCWFFRSALPCYKYAGPACPCYAVMGDNRHHSILGASRCAAPCVSDLAPMLVALNAVVHVAGQAGRRTIPMESLFRWSGETTLTKHEMIVAIEIPTNPSTTFHYEKFAQWRGDFPEASAAVMMQWDGDRLADIRISIGGVAPLPERAKHVEKAVMQHGIRDENIQQAAQKAVYGALPLKDNKGKVEMLVAVMERALIKARNMHRDSHLEHIT